MSEACSWCGEPVAADTGLRAFEPAGARRATFCRLEHVVPWIMRGAAWEADPAPATSAPGGTDAEGEPACAVCDARLGETAVTLVRTRGAHRIPDGFCGVDHLLAWAKAGGRYATR